MGVMVLSKLLEMKTISKMRATFTPENIEEMKKFDPELARKAQIAYSHKLPINFQQLEIIEESFRASWKRRSNSKLLVVKRRTSQLEVLTSSQRAWMFQQCAQLLA